MDLFKGFALWTNLAVFAVAAIAVWIAGSRIARHADTISRKTGIGHATIGLVLLGGVTSLPEVGATITAAWIDNTTLAVNNLFGSIALQITLLAIVDAAIGRRALTSILPDASVLIQGILNVLLLAIAGAGIISGDIELAGVGLWVWLCLAGYVGSILLLAHSPTVRAWRPRPSDPPRNSSDKNRPAGTAGHGSQGIAVEPLRHTIARTSGLAVVILVAGYALSMTGDAIAEQTGIGSSFIGFALLAASTSLPEFSSTLSAARLGNYTMAISDILGTNLLNIGLLFVVDAIAGGEPVLNVVGPSAAFGAVLGICLTTLFMIGVLERRDRTVLRMGYDSAAVLLVYFGGLAILYGLA
jgi:cation:H+ antiporter